MSGACCCCFTVFNEAALLSDDDVVVLLEVELGAAKLLVGGFNIGKMLLQPTSQLCRWATVHSFSDEALYD